MFYVLSLLQQSTKLKQPYIANKYYYSEAVSVLFETFNKMFVNFNNHSHYFSITQPLTLVLSAVALYFRRDSFDFSFCKKSQCLQIIIILYFYIPARAFVKNPILACPYSCVCTQIITVPLPYTLYTHWAWTD